MSTLSSEIQPYHRCLPNSHLIDLVLCSWIRFRSQSIVCVSLRSTKMRFELNCVNVNDPKWFQQTLSKCQPLFLKTNLKCVQNAFSLSYQDDASTRVRQKYEFYANMFSVYKHTHTTTQARKPVCIFGNSCHVCASNNFFPFTNLTILASLLCGSISYTYIRIHIKCMQNPKTKTIPCTHYYFFSFFWPFVSFSGSSSHHIFFSVVVQSYLCRKLVF